jgi:hypothetical protein
LEAGFLLLLADLEAGFLLLLADLLEAGFLLLLADLEAGFLEVLEADLLTFLLAPPLREAEEAAQPELHPPSRDLKGEPVPEAVESDMRVS